MPVLILSSTASSILYLVLGYSKLRYNHIANIIGMMGNLPYTIFILEPANEKNFETLNEAYNENKIYNLFGNYGK